MIIYLPDSTMLFENSEQGKTIVLDLPSGGHIIAEQCNDNRLKVLSVNSTDPMDYMNTQYQPGSYLSMQARLEQ